jgi:transcriptional regulator with XRE-family HTH domain
MGIDQTAGCPADGAAVDCEPGPAVARMLLGGRLREARGITREAAGEAIRASESKISRLELGRNGFKQRDVADLLTLYGVSDQTEHASLLALAKKANTPGWLHDYGDVLDRLPGWAEVRVELEQAASLIRSYEAQFIPGLLQTEDYAAAVVRLDYPGASRFEVERRVSLLMRRQQILRRPQPTRLWVVVDEAALRRWLGSSATMRGQLQCLIEIVELSHVTVQVMPFRTGVAAAGPITILRFPEGALGDVVYLDQSTVLYLDKPADVLHYTQVMDRLSTRAERPAATATLLRQILGET